MTPSPKSSYEGCVSMHFVTRSVALVTTSKALVTTSKALCYY